MAERIAEAIRDALEAASLDRYAGRLEAELSRVL